MPNYSYNSCPVCKSGKFRNIGNVNADLKGITIPNDSAIVRCLDCALIYVNPMPFWTKMDFSFLYDEKYFDTASSNSQKKWLQIREHENIEKRFSRIKKYLQSEKKSLLEVGSGVYAFMCKYLIKSGWNVTAQEPSEEISKQLKRSFPEMKISTDDFILFPENTKYSLIYADSVFEHVPNPMVYVNKCASLLEKGGILYFISPNEHSLINYLLTMLNRVRGKSVHYLSPYKSPYHLIGFSKKSLEILARESGLQLITYIKRYDYMWFHIIEQKKNFLKYPIALFLYLIDRFGWGYNLEIILQKK